MTLAFPDPSQEAPDTLSRSSAPPSSGRVETRRLVPPHLTHVVLDPGPGIAPFWKGISALLGLSPRAPVADGPVSLTMMRHVRLRRVALEVVPWGVITAVGHGWEEVDQIVHESIQQTAGTNDRGWPDIKSFLYVDVGGERFQSVCDFKPALDELPKRLRALAAEAERSIALDVEGAASVEPQSGDAARRVLAAGRAIARSEMAQDLCDVRASSYRMTTRTMRDEGVMRLHTMLTERPADADRAPLAAVIAAELHAEALLGELVAAIANPSPMVAAICRSAALRLGAPLRECGDRRCLYAFLDDGDVRALDAWSTGFGG